ncbi:uncharacterized protein F5Z01DRAFT_196043 [Emericellopsis atlantica]|uniref:Uncharacterized protein n=1 Tax=Emericellopsis atlantica TaxID=2614577 RepID=A0A9P8CTN3_9HYPO|nr:uncharacterized protein F5Z01DRAFT_196043 [Emericellopsis atlantica]KAG9258420.1 hypothetical protein F5Z01DRAFT_196043 [Emericellopsis atlantica]
MFRTIAIVLILSCALVGGYGGMYLAVRHGFFDAVKICTTKKSMWLKPRCVLARSGPTYRPAYTGIPAIDDALGLLLEFFAVSIVNYGQDIDWQGVVTMSYMAAQFGGLWSLMSLEGLRKKNRRTVFSYTGAWGMLGQLVTITIAAPIYLAFNVLYSPDRAGYEDVVVDPTDADILPWVSTISYMVPSLLMVLPSLGVLSPRENYIIIALWQPFPLLHSFFHPLVKKLVASDKKPKETTDRLLVSLRSVYKFVMTLSGIAHGLTIGTVILSKTLSNMPGLSLSKMLVPTSLTDPPIRTLMKPPVSALAQKEIVTNFLRWDIYCACAAFAVWAVYQKHQALPQKSLLRTVGKIGFWTAVAGPIASAAALLRERDVEVLERIELNRQIRKTK